MPEEHNEYTTVELPFIEQLRGMGWGYLEGDIDVPDFTERESFREVLLLKRLREVIRRINLTPEGEPWLDDQRINQAVSRLQRLDAHRLMEANQVATKLLLTGTEVDGIPEMDGGRDQAVHFIDFEHPERNDFLVVNQFRVDPPWAVGDRDFIIPDLVLFVNGIPLVVVECKSPAITEPMVEGITQLLRYSNQRPEVEEPEGAERLFRYNQFMVSTFFHEARVATIGASYDHYMGWKDTSPVPTAEVGAELGVDELSSQQTLIAGMLRKEHLLDIVQNFTLFRQDEGSTVKIVGRYQQFRAVHRAVRRLQTGQTRRQHGEFDLRGGIVWHTQGSGKSLTMVFLVRRMRTLTALRKFKIVVVTDRIDLERQFGPTADLTGETVRPVGSAEDLKAALAEEGSDLVLTMLQKYQSWDEDQSEPETGLFPVLNESESILVLVDEAHRSHASTLHANLMRALPNCARIGFTGTPILIGAQKKTHEIFGEFIDIYTIEQSQSDEATLRILYEGRFAEGVVAEGSDLDEAFDDVFSDKTPEERAAIKAKHARPPRVLEAPKLIAAKARDMLRHYVDTVLPNGFKAQAVAVSRLGAVRYHKAFLVAQREFVEELERLDPSLLTLPDETLAQCDAQTQFLVRAHGHLDRVRQLEFAVIISGRANDPPAWKEWTAKTSQESRIADFKKPFEHKDPEKRSNLAVLIVKSMLLVGFDAPIEQVLYLDRSMRGHEVLQAIARVNRRRSGKQCGYVVDYYGVAGPLSEALKVYRSEDVHGALVSIRDELPILDARHKRVVEVFHARGVSDINDTAACVLVLRDTAVRAEFTVRLKQFLQSLDTVMPRPEALPYVGDAKTLGFICKAAANRYRDSRLSIAGAGQKVRALIDRHIVASGIDPRVAPISIMAPEFQSQVEALPTAPERACEMEHAARHHISTHMGLDPAYYKRLSERLEEILQEFADNWEELVRALRRLVADVRKGRPADGTGLDPRTQAPFLGILVEEASPGGEVSEEQLRDLASVTVEAVEHIAQEIQMVDFWRNVHAQSVLRKWLVGLLDSQDAVPFDRLEGTADRLVQLAKALHTRLTT